MNVESGNLSPLLAEAVQRVIADRDFCSILCLHDLPSKVRFLARSGPPFVIRGIPIQWERSGLQMADLNERNNGVWGEREGRSCKHRIANLLPPFYFDATHAFKMFSVRPREWTAYPIRDRRIAPKVRSRGLDVISRPLVRSSVKPISNCSPLNPTNNFLLKKKVTKG